MAALSTAALVVMVASAAYQYKQSEKQQELQERSAEESRQQAALSQRRADYQAVRNQRAAIRQARVARAQIANQAAQTGTSFSSTTAGATGSIETQLASNLGYLETERQYGRDIFASTATQLGIQNQIGHSQVRSAAAGVVGSAAGGIFQAEGGWKAVVKPEPTGNEFSVPDLFD